MPQAATAAQPASTDQTTQGAEEEMLGAAARAAGSVAPWKRGIPWGVVVAQGVVLGVAGLVVWLAPGFGAAAVLQLIGLLLLLTAALSAWRLIRDRVAPSRVASVAFRAGVGMTVGLIVVIGAFITESRDTTVVAIAAVLGIGLVLYGLAAFVTAFIRREAGSPLPIVMLIISALTVVVGVVLILQARSGIEALTSAFTWLGILLLIVGVALVGYGWMLRSRGTTEAED
jgi:uncharacterized membrane protein HdeD (DUF308 family)